MTTAHKVTAAALVVCAALMITFGYGWFKEHDAAIVIAAQQKADANAEQHIQAAEAANQEQLTSTLATYTSLKQQTTTPVQIVQQLPKVITLPAPIVQVTQAQADAAAKAPALPDAPAIQAGDLVIPKADSKAFFDAQVDCKAGAAKLISCGQTTANLTALDAVKDTQINQLQTALKGGTKLHRAKSALTWGTVGAVVGAGVVAYFTHK